MNLKLSIVNYQLSIFVAITLFFALPLKAQVTIGAQQAPHSYSVLELMSAKGLRLPVLNNSERDALKLTSDSTEANGLFIYNTDINCVEFWSKGKWIDLRDNSSFLSPISGNNGVTKGATGLTYSVTPVSDLATYTWTVPADWSITGGQGTASITVTAGNIEGHAGAITVTANNGNCTETSTLAVSVGCPVRTTSGSWLTFMCYNLGADENMSIAEQMAYVPKDSLDETVSGSLYQWGRIADGHQLRTSQAYPTNDTIHGSGVVSSPNLDNNGQVVSTFDAYGKFIKNDDSIITHCDWRNPQVDTLWYNNGKKTVNDPCPTGWRIPTSAEWKSIFREDPILNAPWQTTVAANTWTFNTNTGSRGFLIKPEGSSEATLFLPGTGYRSFSSDVIMNIGNGYYWSNSSSSDNSGSYYFSFTRTDLYPGSHIYRTYGFSVRCVAE